MRKFIGVFRMDIHRALRSPLFYLTIIAFTLVQLAGVWQEITLIGESNVLYLYYAGNFPTASLMFAALPFATAFCTEWRCHFTPYAMKRSSVYAYAWSKMASATLAGGLAVVLGYVLFFGILALRFPLMTPGSNIYDVLVRSSPYGSLLQNGQTLLFFAAILLCHALSAMIFAGVTVTISGFIPNLFVALAAPMLFYYVNLNAIPNDWINLLSVLDIFGTKFGGMTLTMLYQIAYTTGTLAIFGWIFFVGIQRRLRHG